jgi:hypothetical protein
MTVQGCTVRAWEIPWMRVRVVNVDPFDPAALPPSTTCWTGGLAALLTVQ